MRVPSQMAVEIGDLELHRLVGGLQPDHIQ
ncbi:hypothetical protein [Burkholderia contaminans]|nr:hypothetical protein [Burkholderia contaminans]